MKSGKGGGVRTSLLGVVLGEEGAEAIYIESKIATELIVSAAHELELVERNTQGC